jgi:hypothetical protein
MRKVPPYVPVQLLTYRSVPQRHQEHRSSLWSHKIQNVGLGRMEKGCRLRRFRWPKQGQQEDASSAQSCMFINLSKIA